MFDSDFIQTAGALTCFGLAFKFIQGSVPVSNLVNHNCGQAFRFFYNIKIKDKTSLEIQNSCGIMTLLPMLGNVKEVKYHYCRWLIRGKLDGFVMIDCRSFAVQRLYWFMNYLSLSHNDGVVRKPDIDN